MMKKTVSFWMLVCFLIQGCSTMFVREEAGAKLFTIVVFEPEDIDEDAYQPVDSEPITIKIDESSRFVGGLFGDSYSQDCVESDVLYCLHANTSDGLLVPTGFNQKENWSFRGFTYTFEECLPHYCTFVQRKNQRVMAKYYWSAAGGLHGVVTFVGGKPYSQLMRLN